MKSFKVIITAGFAMFSMFFGSGNLVFPLTIGAKTLNQSNYAIFGLLLTGVCVPFLGLIGVILNQGDHTSFLKAVGKAPAFLLTLTMLSLLGPFGVIPRCILVAYGGIGLFFPNLPFPLFSFFFCLITFILIWNHDLLIPIIARYLTPVLLLGVTTLIVFGIIKSSPAEGSSLNSFQAFQFGLFEGYQTMDLLAAFFFSATIVSYLRKHAGDTPHQLRCFSTGASIIGAGLIGLIYLGFVLLGSRYGSILSSSPPEQMLSMIASITLGPLAIPIASITLALTCLTTSTILSQLFSDFLHQDISNQRITPHWAIIVTLVISFFISLQGFDYLRIFLINILFVAYPALIALTIANIIYKITNINLNRLAFWTMLILSASTKAISF